MTTNLGDRLRVEEILPAYWTVTIENPPINLFDPRMFAAMNQLMDRIDAAGDLKIVVFDSADPDYFMAHFDIEDREIPDVPGAMEFTRWPVFVTRLAESRVLSVAKLRGRARGHGSEFALACDVRFASREKAVLSQIEAGSAIVPGGGGIEWLSALVGRSRALEIILGADDFDAETAERYGWVNRAVPDAELDAFVDRFARRVVSFDKGALELGKRLVNARAGVPSEGDRWSSNRLSLAAASSPVGLDRAAKLLRAGLQQEGEFEFSLGRRIGELD